MISKMMGELKRSDYSQTTSDSGQSLTQSIRDEKVLRTSEIAAQQTGHFSGRIQGGDPPYFSAQFKCNSYNVEDIPNFNYPIGIDDIEMQEALLSAMVEENYQQVRTDVANLFQGYQNLFETESAEAWKDKRISWELHVI